MSITETSAIRGENSEHSLAYELFKEKLIKLKPTHHTDSVARWESVGLNEDMIKEMNGEKILKVEEVEWYPFSNHKPLFEVRVRTNQYVYPFVAIQGMVEE